MGAIPEQMFSVREAAWHDPEGRFVREEYPEDFKQAREWAGQDWDPLLVPSFAFSGIDAAGAAVHAPGEGVTGDYFADAEIDGNGNRKPLHRIVRTDTGATLSHCRDSYELITNSQMWEIAEAMEDQTGTVVETGGVMEGGKEVWALFRLGDPIQLPGDNGPTLPFMALLNRHDGGGALKAIGTGVKVVCQNTWKASEMQGERDGTTYTFPHTKGWNLDNRIEEAKTAVRGARAEFQKVCDLMTELLGVSVSRTQTGLFVERFFPMPIEGTASLTVKRNVEEARSAFREILDSPTSEGIAGTAYGVIQAAGEFLDHSRRYQSRETYVRRTLLRAEPGKTKAINLMRSVLAEV